MSAYYNEIEPFAAQWLRNLISKGLIADGEVDTRSIVDVRSGDLTGFTQCHFFAGIGGWSLALRNAGWTDDRAVWTGSCPCQPFSLAGKQKGFDDERHLWPVWRELIRECDPAVVFGEQVASATDWLGLVRSDLEAMGRAVGAMPIQAASAGADHLRDRYWFVAADMGDPDSAGLALRSIAEVERGDVRSKGPAATAPGYRSITLADTDQLGASAERSERGGQFGGAGGDPEARVGELADADSAARRRAAGHAEPGSGAEALRERPAQSGRCGGAIDLANTMRGRAGDESGRGDRAETAALGIDGDASRSSVAFGIDGSDLEWVIGADGKARRVKSGIRLLAHGVSGRVGKLRGFGNAIDPRPASAFIRAYMACRP